MATSILDRPVLLDTNVLTALQDVDHLRHTEVVALIATRQHDAHLYVAPQSLYEYWVVATRPKAQNGLAFTIADVVLDVADFRLLFTVLPDPADLLDEWLDLCRTHGVSGKNAHDARLAAYARLHGVGTLVTLNARDFARFGLNVVVP